jgi:hypothetical protein
MQDQDRKTYDEQLIDEGVCPELVPVFSEDFGWGDGRCLAPIVPGGFACPGHTAEIEAWRGMSEAERAADEYARDMMGEA